MKQNVQKRIIYLTCNTQQEENLLNALLNLMEGQEFKMEEQFLILQLGLHNCLLNIYLIKKIPLLLKINYPLLLGHKQSREQLREGWMAVEDKEIQEDLAPVLLLHNNKLYKSVDQLVGTQIKLKVMEKKGLVMHALTIS